MTEKEKKAKYEFRKSFKNYELVIDRGKIATAILLVIVVVLLMLFMFSLADVV